MSRFEDTGPEVEVVELPYEQRPQPVPEPKPGDDDEQLE